ncbi:hypothetical protein VaNZ11_007879, partial [Volvox africanus]
ASALPSRFQAAAGLGGGAGNFIAGAGGGGGGGTEKKLTIAGVRTWLKVLPDGSATIVQLDRAQLGLEYGVQLRDFRVLDTVLGATYPACLLCRDGALIVNLDPIKVIITAHFALVNHTESDKARPFIDELKRRLRNYLASKMPHPNTHLAPIAGSPQEGLTPLLPQQKGTTESPTATAATPGQRAGFADRDASTTSLLGLTAPSGAAAAAAAA